MMTNLETNWNNDAGRCIVSFRDGLNKIYVFEFPDLNEGYIEGWIFVFNYVPYFCSIAGGSENLSNYLANFYALYLATELKEMDRVEKAMGEDDCWTLTDDESMQFHELLQDAMTDAGYVMREDGGWRHKREETDEIPDCDDECWNCPDNATCRLSTTVVGDCNPNKDMKKYKVTHYYSTMTSVVVNAKNEEDAEAEASEMDTDDQILANLQKNGTTDVELLPNDEDEGDSEVEPTYLVMCGTKHWVATVDQLADRISNAGAECKVIEIRQEIADTKTIYVYDADGKGNFGYSAAVVGGAFNVTQWEYDSHYWEVRKVISHKDWKPAWSKLPG